MLHLISTNSILCPLKRRSPSRPPAVLITRPSNKRPLHQTFPPNHLPPSFRQAAHVPSTCASRNHLPRMQSPCRMHPPVLHRPLKSWPSPAVRQQLQPGQKLPLLPPPSPAQPQRQLSRRECKPPSPPWGKNTTATARSCLPYRPTLAGEGGRGGGARRRIGMRSNPPPRPPFDARQLRLPPMTRMRPHHHRRCPRAYRTDWRAVAAAALAVSRRAPLPTRALPELSWEDLWAPASSKTLSTRAPTASTVPPGGREGCAVATAGWCIPR
mmetsp:Transcript_22877/g.67541  ORF Transcript_22877/g.67541 Transcript_22877/m.67541 type:complete len:269 (-) Transcript_22877:499-1305(-)